MQRALRALDMLGIGIGSKLMLAFAGLAGVTVLVVVLALVAGRKATDDIRMTEEVRAPAWIEAEQAQASLLEMQLHVRGYLVLSDRADIEQYQMARREFEQNLASLQAMSNHRPQGDEAQWVAELTQSYARWVRLPQELFDLHDDPLKNRPALRIARVDLQALRVQVLNQIDAIIALQRTREAEPSSRGMMAILLDFQASFDAMATNLLAYATSGELNFKLAYGPQLATNATIWNSLLAARSRFSAEQRFRLDSIARDRARMAEFALQIVSVLNGEHANEDLYLYRTEVAPQAEAMTALLAKVTASQQSQLRSELGRARQQLLDARTKTLFGGALAVVLAVAMALVFRRRIVGPVQRLTTVAERVASGDLSARAAVESSDEIGVLAISINTMTQRLANMIQHLEAANAEAECAKNAAMVANRAKSNFLATMSHELRTPLNGILGFAQILRRDKPLTERQQRGLRIIEESGQHLLTLINDILDLARIDAAKLELFPSEIDLRNFLLMVSDIVQVKAEEKSLQFRYEPSPGLPSAVLADDKRLRQVLLNLLSNAVKFTDRGVVSLRAGAIGQAADGVTRLRFEVHDSGIGMNAAQMARLFQPFEQVGEANRRDGGTGLGLAISRQLVRLMGGDIDVTSEPGKGSVFSFEIDLPLAKGSAAPAVNRGLPVDYEGPRKRVLVVDDVEQNRAILVEALGVLGFEVQEAAHGAECVDLVRSARPDLIIMDTVMPVMDGYEATRRIRAMRERKDVPIIATSASATQEVGLQCRQAGANVFIAKPIEQERLLEEMGRLMDLHWVYAEAASGASTVVGDGYPAGPIPPPKDVAELCRLARTGNMRAVREWADHLKSLDAKYLPFSARVSVLAEGGQPRAIETLVRRCCGELERL